MLARKSLLISVVVAAVMLLAGCSGRTTGASDFNSSNNTIKLSAVGSCDTTCTVFMRYRVVGTSAWTNAPSFSVGRLSNVPWSQTVTVWPGANYEYQVCGKEASWSGFACIGPDGGGGSTQRFTAYAPTTLSITAQPALFPGFDPAVSDYVTRCASSPVAMTVEAPTGTQVSVDGQAPRSGTFTQYVPLATGQGFSVATIAGGQTRSHYVRCLPGDFPDWSFSRSAQPTLDGALVTLASGSARYVALFDKAGVPVWWYRPDTYAADAKLLSDDTVAFAEWELRAFNTSGSSRYQIRRLDGSLVRTLSTVGTPTDFHDLQELVNGNNLMVSYRPRDHVDLSPYGGPSDATVLDGEIQEVAPNGSLVWSWNSKDHIDLSETGRWWPTAIASPTTLPDGRVAYDLVHINSVEPDGDSLLASFRQTDAVYRISLSDGHVEWKLGGTTTDQSLTVSGDDQASPFGGQHDARRLADGTVSVHDNGTNLNRPPRAVRFQIDPTAKTATLVEKLSDSDIPTSNCCGSARKLGSGGWLVDWGGTPTVAEYASDGTRISKLTFSNVFSYRAFPVAAGRISPSTLRQAMNTMYPR
jgi:hypothetical protein